MGFQNGTPMVKDLSANHPTSSTAAFEIPSGVSGCWLAQISPPKIPPIGGLGRRCHLVHSLAAELEPYGNADVL